MGGLESPSRPWEAVILGVFCGFVLMAGGGIGAVMAAMGALTGRQTPLGEFALRISCSFVVLLMGGFLVTGPVVRAGSGSAGSVAASAGRQKIAAGLSLFVALLITLLALLALGLDTGESRGQPAGALTFAAVLGIPAVLLLLGANRVETRMDRQLRLDALRAGADMAAGSAGLRLAPVVEDIPEGILDGLRLVYAEGRIPPDPRGAGLACATCGAEGALRSTTLQKYTGLIVFTRISVTRGLLCGPCITRIAGEYNHHAAVLGWWSLHGILGTLIALPQNRLEAGAARDLPPPGTPVDLDAAAVERLRPHAAWMVDRLAAGMDPAEVFREAASRAGVTPGQACRFAAALAGMDRKN